MARKPKSPFKDIRLLQYEISNFLSAHAATISNHAERISDYFEMSAYNSVVKHYDNNGYSITINNLIDGKFKYKLSPAGYPSNFSYFTAQKTYTYKGTVTNHIFEIHHNLTVASGRSSGIYVTPDISIINQGTITNLTDPKYFFSGSRKYCYVDNSNLKSFCEVKNLNPFPELLFSFIGLLNELKPKVFDGQTLKTKPYHIAPSLMLSGGGNYHVREIKKQLLDRYNINIFYGLFYSHSQAYSARNSANVIKIGST